MAAMAAVVMERAPSWETAAAATVGAGKGVREVVWQLLICGAAVTLGVVEVLVGVELVGVLAVLAAMALTIMTITLTTTTTTMGVRWFRCTITVQCQWVLRQWRRWRSCQ
jgi:hypothetical protein